MQGKVVLQIDEDGEQPELPLAEEGGPCMVIRLQPMAGGLCRFSYTTLATEEEERSVVDISEVSEKIVTTSKQY